MAEPADKPYKPLHLAETPGGDCRICGDPWPCATERAALLTEYRGDARPSLLIYLALQLISALDHVPDEAAAGLCSRYLAWVPQEIGRDPALTPNAERRKDTRHETYAA